MKHEPLTKEKKEIERILALLSHAESLWCGEKVTLIFLSSNDAEEFQTLFEKHKEKLLELSGSPLLELLTTKKEMRLKEKVKKKVKQRVNQLLKEIEKEIKKHDKYEQELREKGLYHEALEELGFVSGLNIAKMLIKKAFEVIEK